jgi:hypothetical protein
MGFAPENGPGMDGRLKPVKNETCSEIVNSSARLSPFEDFRQRSLERLQGLWRRLLYLSELRAADGKYEHWGLNRTYGRETAEKVMGGAHSGIYVQMLRMPLAELMRDIEISAIDAGNTVDALLETTAANAGKMVPKELLGGAPRHFNSVVLAACALRSAQLASTRPTA